MRVHFIAIGGAAMHNMAIALKLKGFEVTGSDDEIFDPSKSRLDKHGLLPVKSGWFPERLSNNIDAVILGMHARENNPELARAVELGLKIYSYPEYVYEQSKEKTRVVIGGSHGKTSITSMILHVLNYHGIENDYLVGAQLDGFECMVKLSDAPLIILEGDEYLSSPIDRKPKFLWYRPHIALLSGIAWDHINVFPTFEYYVSQFKLFSNSIESNGSLIYYEGDEHLQKIAFDTEGINCQPYLTHAHEIIQGKTHLKTENALIPVQIFGDHNLQNLNGARLVCNQLGITDDQFYEAIQTFTGAAKRLESIASGESFQIYKDFAHSPSKLKATTEAVKKQWGERRLVACMELHTFSSLNSNFLRLYGNTMREADRAIVYYNPEVVNHKKLDPLNTEQIKRAFNHNQLEVYTDPKEFMSQIEAIQLVNTNLLLMSSGNFGGIHLDEFAKKLAEKATEEAL